MVSRQSNPEPDPEDLRRYELIECRKVRGLTQEMLAELVGVSADALASWERGVWSPHVRYRPKLAAALRLSLDEINRMLNREPPRMSSGGHRVARWLSHYDSLVQGAGRIQDVELKVIPALLQTKEYALVVEGLGPVPPPGDVVAERVEVRLRRQQVLHRDEPFHFAVALDEGILHDEVGSPSIMHRQLGHLLELAAMSTIDLRVLPRDGRSICAVSTFELLTKPDEDEPFMVCTFDAGGPRYWESDADLQLFTTMFDHLHNDLALDPAESTRRIERIRGSYR